MMFQTGKPARFDFGGHIVCVDADLMVFQTGEPARFDFAGHIVSDDSDLPVDLGC